MASCLTAAILFVCLEGAFGGVFTDIKTEITLDAQAIKQPIDETVLGAVSSQCENLKKIIGVSYDKLDGAKEPDVNLLKLEFRTSAFRSIYNISVAAGALPRSGDYDRTDKLVVYIHGFTDNPEKNSFSSISESFLEKGGFNVLALDGSMLINWLYLRSSTYVRFMGEKLGETMAAMVKDGIKATDILIVGHSLGAHIGSFAGKTFYNLTGTKIGRISGLDPAGPCFTKVEPELRLNKTDAIFVDVIHTDAGVYGLKEAVGQVDFYVNGGNKQPNCLLQTCSHSRAWQLYSESINEPTAFLAKKCKDWATFKNNTCGNTQTSYMGYATKPPTSGIFYLRTNGSSPYGLGAAGLTYEEKIEGVVNNVADGIGKLFG